MKQKRKKKSYNVRNLPPGTMSYRGKKESTVTHIDLINYSASLYNVTNSQNVEDGFDIKEKDTVTWININGLNNITDIEKIGRHFQLHALTLEDIVNTHHRPKIDEFDDYLFIVCKMLHLKDDQLIYEHMSMVVGAGYVLTFQEADGDVFDGLRGRISEGKGRIRTMGSDYLMYGILDAIVDHYLTVIEAFGDKIEELEDSIFTDDTNKSTPIHIQELKQEILRIRRSVIPLREVISRLEKTESPLIELKTHNFIRDLYDHIVQVNENVELHREMIWSLMDMYMTIISHKMNEVMKVLTIIATIFIPLTFIAGIYGMNFDNIPELHYKYGYHILWGVMILIFIGMLVYFRRKKWL